MSGFGFVSLVAQDFRTFSLDSFCYICYAGWAQRTDDATLILKCLLLC